ncbi:hypothetical protein K0M31_003480 [Melipona bicolor]|uniref:Uncharacterized protein n=1 Tax=Melipona bicolor TaxID=60889 RepID=A0AA40FYZ5_9HYME|nr:hypothetical protein K0M31_003480 [Melipona bicolor]
MLVDTALSSCCNAQRARISDSTGEIRINLMAGLRVGLRRPYGALARRAGGWYGGVAWTRPTGLHGWRSENASRSLVLGATRGQREAHPPALSSTSRDSIRFAWRGTIAAAHVLVHTHVHACSEQKRAPISGTLKKKRLREASLVTLSLSLALVLFYSLSMSEFSLEV